MIDRHIARISLRRGTESQRLQITPLTGELIYTTDTKKVYVGDGNPGGYLLSNRNFVISANSLPSVSSIPAVFGDIVVNRKTNSTHIVTGSGAQDYYTITQEALVINGSDTINVDGGTISINPDVFGDGLNYNSTVGIVSTNVDDSTIYINNSSLSVKFDSSRGLSSDNDGIYLNIDDKSIIFDANSSLSLNLKSDGGLSSNNDGVYVSIDGTSILLEGGKLKVNASALMTGQSGYIIEAKDGISYGDVITDSITARTLSAVLDHNTITLNNSGAISILNLPADSVGRVQCKTDIISGGDDPISFNSLSGLYLDKTKLLSLLNITQKEKVGFKKFPEIASGQVVNNWHCITILCTDGKLRTIGSSHNYRSGTYGWDGTGNMYNPPKMRVITRDIDYELDSDDEIIKFRSEWYSTWFLTKRGRMFFWGYSAQGESGFAPTPSTGNIVTKYIEIPLSGAKVIDFKVGSGLFSNWGILDTGNLYAPANTIFAIASLSGIVAFNTHPYLSAFSTGDKTAEFVGISWGYNASGQTGVNSKNAYTLPTIIYDYTQIPAKPFSVKKITSVGAHTYGCAYLIDKDDQVWATGSNGGLNLGVPAASALGNILYFQKCQVRPSATYVGGKLTGNQTRILLKAEDIVGTNSGADYGNHTMVFAISGGYAYSCGRNTGSQAGHSIQGPADAFLPVNIDTSTKLSGIQEILTTNSYNIGCSVFARTSSGLFGWGRNWWGELGLGHIKIQTFATEIKLKNIKGIVPLTPSNVIGWGDAGILGATPGKIFDEQNGLTSGETFWCANGATGRIIIDLGKPIVLNKIDLYNVYSQFNFADSSDRYRYTRTFTLCASNTISGSTPTTYSLNNPVKLTNGTLTVDNAKTCNTYYINDTNSYRYLSLTCSSDSDSNQNRVHWAGLREVFIYGNEVGAPLIGDESITNIVKMQPYGYCNQDRGGGAHFIILTTDGDIYMSGDAKLGNGIHIDNDCTLFLTKINRIKNKKWVDFKSSGTSYYGREIIYAVTEDGELYGWGTNLGCQIFFPSSYSIGNAIGNEEVGYPVLIPITD